MASLDLTKPATLKKMHPLDAREFVDQVLLPELVCMLIQDDMGGEKSGITYDAAEAMQQASQKFGIAMFPSEHAPSAHTSKRGSGAWIGASPKRAKKGDTDLAAVRKPRGGLVQQTLAVRRSARTASSSSVSYVDDSSSDEEVTETHISSPSREKHKETLASKPTYHQQRLYVPSRSASSDTRPAPRPAPTHASSTTKSS